MGPNGSGKSTLAYALMGHPAYEVTEGEILFDGEDLVELGADERAQRGLFLAFQYPHAVPGVTVTNFLRSAINSIRKARRRRGRPDPDPRVPQGAAREDGGAEGHPRARAALHQRRLLRRRAKKMEMLQLAMLKPRMAVLDETDTGLDIDALKVVGEGVNTLVGPEMGALVITHYPRVLQYIKPDFVHVFFDGRIVAEGGPELAHKLEAEGYKAFIPDLEEAVGMSSRTRPRPRSSPRSATTTSTASTTTEDYFFKSGRGLSREIVEAISEHKNEPDWMRKFRLKALDYFMARPMPTWGGDIERDRLRQHLLLHPPDREAGELVGGPAGRTSRTPGTSSGIPEAERKFLAGVGAQYESEVVYHKLQEDLEKKGVIFLDMDSGLREHEDLVKQYFGTIIPQNDNKFAALNSAVWSGGSFIYVPPGVRIEMPLQAYFRINAENMGQFERTLIIVDEDAYVHYVEGCTAPIYSTDSLHSAVVEIIVKPRGRCRYTTIQNWSTNVYNLVTKRAVAYEDATMEWVDGNLGSKLTMKYPAIWLMGERAHGEVLSIAFAGNGQHQDAGGKVRPRRAEHDVGDHLEVDLEERRARRLPRPARGRRKGAHGSKSKVVCDALILDDESRSDTYPYIQIDENDVDIGHEATVSKIGEEQLFYLMSRGLSEAEASAMIVSGFVEPITKELPLEYAVEMNRLIQLQMEGSRRLDPVTRRRLRRRPVHRLEAIARVLRRDARARGPTRPASGRVLDRRDVLRDLRADAVRDRVRAADDRAHRDARRRRRRGAGGARGGRASSSRARSSTPGSATWRSSRSGRERAHAPPLRAP